jgi:exocyst complex component 2
MPQDVRLLLVISNFRQLMGSFIPSMITQLENAFGISMERDRAASFKGNSD